jgi:putative drug exporter of the RND superfamily
VQRKGKLVLRNIARFCYRQRWATLGIWILILIGAFAISSVFGGETRTEFSLPGSETQEAVDVLEAAGFGTRAGIQAQIVFEAENGVMDPAVREPMERLFERIEAEVRDVSIVSPYPSEGARQITPDGTIAYAELNFAERNIEEYTKAAEQIREMRDTTVVPGTRVELGGEIFGEFSEPSSELIGLIAAMIILLIAFGSLLAMGLPIMTALFGVGCGVAVIGFLTNVLAVPEFTPLSPRSSASASASTTRC